MYRKYYLQLSTLLISMLPSLKYLSKFVEVIIHATLATTATVLSSSYSLIADLYREYDCRSQDGRTACYKIGD